MAIVGTGPSRETGPLTATISPDRQFLPVPLGQRVQQACSTHSWVLSRWNVSSLRAAVSSVTFTAVSPEPQAVPGV